MLLLVRLHKLTGIRPIKFISTQKVECTTTAELSSAILIKTIWSEIIPARNYFIDKNGNVIGSDGRKLGMAKKNGSYYNINGENVLNTKDIDKENCAILDPHGHNFGTTHKNYKLHACAAHCYWLMQAKKKAAKKS